MVFRQTTLRFEPNSTLEVLLCRMWGMRLAHISTLACSSTMARCLNTANPLHCDCKRTHKH